MTPQTVSSIALYNGDFFDFNDPESHDFDIDVISHALANICRFTGHTIRHYSVAEHSVLVSRLLPDRYALDGLMHDAAEAYIGDVSSPLKALLPEYRKIEEKVEKALARHFGTSYPMPDVVKAVDKSLYLAEVRQMTYGSDKLWSRDKVAPDVMIAGMQAKDAKQFFLSRFRELTQGKSRWVSSHEKTPTKRHLINS